MSVFTDNILSNMQVLSTNTISKNIECSVVSRSFYDADIFCVHHSYVLSVCRYYYLLFAMFIIRLQVCKLVVETKMDRYSQLRNQTTSILHQLTPHHHLSSHDNPKVARKSYHKYTYTYLEGYSKSVKKLVRYDIVDCHFFCVRRNSVQYAF